MANAALNRGKRHMKNPGDLGIQVESDPLQTGRIQQRLMNGLHQIPEPADMGRNADVQQNVVNARR